MNDAPFLTKLNQWLTPARLNYTWIAGGVLWLGWLVSISFGSGYFDAAGQVIGTDYLQFYSAGETLRSGQGDRLYDANFQLALERSIVGEQLDGQFAFITLPFLAWLYVPLSFLPYIPSFIVWSLLSGLLLWLSLRWLGMGTLRTFGFALMWYPVFAAISFGQNSLLTLGLFGLGYALWKRKRPFLAGLVVSLVLYKPQLILGIGFLWLVRWKRDWKALIGLTAGSLVLIGLGLLFLPQASLDYLKISREVLPEMIWLPDFPIWHVHTVRGFFRLLFPGIRVLADVVSLLLTLPAIVFYYLFLRRYPGRDDLYFSGAILMMMWITPHAMVYEWSVLLIPAVLLWRAVPEMRDTWRPLFLLMWLATFLSTALTNLQLALFSAAFQVTIPVFAYVLFVVYRSLSGLPKEQSAG
ncbi:MAG: DUF2029 domain-containing protein [Anaerolineales bacterium]|nr:DUF2029 domain-containing protein [Anaerolineales bacterium]